MQNIGCWQNLFLSILVVVLQKTVSKIAGRVFPYNYIILQRWSMKRHFDPHIASRWRSQVRPVHIFEKVQTIARLSAPSFLFDSLSRDSLSNYRESWDKLSNYLNTQCKISCNSEKITESFTKYSHLVGEWCFRHCPFISVQWSAYIAKYPWTPISPRMSYTFKIGVCIYELWYEAKWQMHLAASHSAWIYPGRACKKVKRR